jgi:hypothetical protein
MVLSDPVVLHKPVVDAVARFCPSKQTQQWVAEVGTMSQRYVSVLSCLELSFFSVWLCAKIASFGGCRLLLLSSKMYECSVLLLINLILMIFLFSFIKVWSPAGGWWSNPAQWKRNTGVAFAVVAVCAVGIFQVSAAKERRPIPPRTHIPSQLWSKHAIEDDPSLARK